MWMALHTLSGTKATGPSRLVVAYVRPELKFESTMELCKEISLDGAFCREALERPELQKMKMDTFLRPEHRLKLPVISGAGLRETLQGLPRVRSGCTRLLLTRHGETKANEQGVLCGGGYESQLNAQGQRQAKDLAAESLRLHI